LTDHLDRRVIPGLVTTSVPDHEFWHGIDLRTPLPRRGLLDSVFAHAALLGLLYVVSIWPDSSAHLADPFSHRALDGYTLSQYLPELHGAPTHLKTNGKYDPVPAKQEIISLPETPDNLRQTISTPPKLKLQRDVDIPNIVAYEPATPVQPLAASERDSISLRLPRFVPEVIGPAADTGSLRSNKKLPNFEPQIIGPAPDLAQTNPRLVLPAFRPDVVQPAPDLGSVHRGSGTNAALAHLTPPVSEPIPEAPHVTGADARPSSGQIIALSRHPAEVHGPVDVPSGNRRGVFAASPKGDAAASGSPGANASAGNGAPGSKVPPNAPPGINVAAAPVAPQVVAAPNGPIPKAQPADPKTRAKFMAAMRPPVMSIPPHQPIARESTAPRSELENRIFAGRRSYTLSVNMPNLNTATGSWVIHFVERVPNAAKSPIAAPEVVSKSDPAYPGELIQDGIQGTVILTAIIRADGSVGDIAVIKSLDPRLDQNAALALSRWLFRPALKDGQAIDLEAIITVPFRTKAAGF
jgi:TonB family protein